MPHVRSQAVVQRTGLEPQEEVAPLSLSALLQSSLIFLPIGVLAASSSPPPLSLPFCDRQGLCLREVLDSAAVLWDS